MEAANFQASFTDHHGNLTDLLELHPGEKEIVLRVSGTVETTDRQGVVGPHTLMMPLWYYTRQTELTRPGVVLSEIINELQSAHQADVGFLHEVSQFVRDKVLYQTGATGVGTSAEDAVQNGLGVCQDHAHVFLSIVRALGFPARYISGYLMLEDRIDQDATHAWAEAHLPYLGWVGFDVSNATSPDERYVQIARGLDYRDAAPTSGLVIGAEHENLVVSLQVQQ